MELDHERRDAWIAAGALFVAGVITLGASLTPHTRFGLFGHLGGGIAIVWGLVLLAAGASVIVRQSWGIYVVAPVSVLAMLAGVLEAAAMSSVVGLLLAIVGAVGMVCALRGHRWFPGAVGPTVGAITREPLRPHIDDHGFAEA